MAEDPFAVLGVGEDASNKKVESAFRRLALRCHPDRHPKDPLAKTRFLRLSHAKEALLDPEKRRAAQNQRRNRQSQRQTPGASTNSPRTAPNDAVNKRRRAAAEQLRKREVEAAEKRRHAREKAKRQNAEAEAKRRCDELAAKREAEAQELAAERERRKVELFEAFLRKKKAKVAPARTQPTHVALSLLVNRFVKSGEQRLTLPGPLSSAERTELRAAAEVHGLIMTEERCSVKLQRCHEASDSDSPWEPPEGTRADKKVHWTCKKCDELNKGSREACNNCGAKKANPLRKRASCSSRAASVGTSDTHRAALERLQVRRQHGEGLTSTPQGSWWVHDTEAERFAKDLDFYGF